MRVLVLLLAGIVVASGCITEEGSKASAVGKSGKAPDGASPTSAGPRPPMPAVISFAPVQVLGTMGGGAEPSVAVGPDGTAYATTPRALWRSDDGGKTWKEIGGPGCSAPVPGCHPWLETRNPGVRGGGDADLWVTPDGHVHWLGLADGPNAIPYQVSTDKGVTWTPVNDLAGDDSGDREWITGTANGTLYASWRNFPAGGTGRSATIKSRASFDGGATWTAASDVAPDTRMGGIAVDPTSKALALAHDSTTGEVRVARSFDHGATWESTLVVDDPWQGQVFPVTAYDGGGTLYLAFAHDRDNAPTDSNRPLQQTNLYLSASKDQGVTWSTPTQVNAPGTTAWFPWIAAGAEGRVVLVWYQNDRGLPRQLTDDVYVMAGFSLDADATKPTFRNVRISPRPIHQGPECRENPGCTRSLLDFFEVAIHPSGYPVAVWAQDTWPVPRVSVAASYMTAGPNLLQ